MVDANDVDLKTSAIMKLQIDKVKNGIISKQKMLTNIDPEMFVQSLHPQINQSSKLDIIGIGLPASPGGISGRIAFKAEEANMGIYPDGGIFVLEYTGDPINPTSFSWESIIKNISILIQSYLDFPLFNKMFFINIIMSI